MILRCKFHWLLDTFEPCTSVSYHHVADKIINIHYRWCSSSSMLAFAYFKTFVLLWSSFRPHKMMWWAAFGLRTSSLTHALRNSMPFIYLFIYLENASSLPELKYNLCLDEDRQIMKSKQDTKFKSNMINDYFTELKSSHVCSSVICSIKLSYEIFTSFFWHTWWHPSVLFTFQTKTKLFAKTENNGKIVPLGLVMYCAYGVLIFRQLWKRGEFHA